MKKTILSFAVIVFTAFVASAQSPAKPTPAAPAKAAPVTPAPAPVTPAPVVAAPVPTPTVTPDPNAPVMVFESEVLDYGTVEYDGDGTREFKFKNTGKEPLIIYSATGSCGCTVPTYAKEPVKPGESSVIKVHYDTKRPGNFEKTVTVSSNSKHPVNETKTLRIHGVVKQAPVAPATSTVAPAPAH